MNVKEWVKKVIRPHLVKECNGLLFPDDCVDMIENDLEGLVKAVKDNTLKSLVAFIRSQAPELEHGDERWGVAKDVEDGSFEAWEKEANAFLKEAIGEKRRPDAKPGDIECPFCKQPSGILYGADLDPGPARCVECVIYEWGQFRDDVVRGSDKAPPNPAHRTAAEKALGDLVDLVEEDEEAQKVGTDLWLTVTTAKQILAAIPRRTNMKCACVWTGDGEDARRSLRPCLMHEKWAEERPRASSPETASGSERPTAAELLRQGGEWLGAARKWLQWHTRNGDQVTWGSGDTIEHSFSVRDIEDLASEVAAAAMRPQPTEERLSSALKARWQAEAELSQLRNRESPPKEESCPVEQSRSQSSSASCSPASSQGSTSSKGSGDVATTTATDNACDPADKPLPEDDAIAAAHPLRTGRYHLYDEALRLVGARFSKGGLVGLVAWLLHRIENHENRPEGESPRTSDAAACICGPEDICSVCREQKQHEVAAQPEGQPSQEWSDEQHMLWLCTEHDKNGTQEFGGAEKDAILRIIGRLRRAETPTPTKGET